LARHHGTESPKTPERVASEVVSSRNWSVALWNATKIQVIIYKELRATQMVANGF
jgi:hypothetical protein